MTVRTTGRTVTFVHPFNLSGTDEVQPAGTYAMETDEESLDSNTRAGFRRIATYIHIQRDGASQVVTVVSADLAVLLHERRRLHKHAARSTRRVIDTTVERLDDLNDQLDDAGGREELAALLSLRHCELA